MTRVAIATGSVLLLVALTASPAEAATKTTTLLAPTTVNVPKPRAPRGLTLKTGVVVDAASGRVLWSRKRNAVRPIASTTKIMTALVALQRGDLSQRLTATRYAAEPGESLLGLRAGERMTVRNLLTALMLASANDAADTLAAGLASSRAAFVAAMNRRARAIGLTRTHYGNAIGMDRPRTVSSAADLATLSRVALRNETFARIVRRSKAVVKSNTRSRRVVNRNELVGRYDFVTGVKTGHTMGAGYVLVGAAKRQNAAVVSAVLGEPSIPARNRDTLKLLRFGRAHFKPVLALPARRVALTLQTSPGGEDVGLAPRESLRVAARDGQRVGVVAETREDLRGPLDRGTRVGTAYLSLDGKRVAATPLLTTTAVAEPTVAQWIVYILSRLVLLLAVIGILFMMGVALTWRRKRARTVSMSRDRSRASAANL